MNGETTHVDISDHARFAAKVVTIRYKMDERVAQKRRRQRTLVILGAGVMVVCMAAMARLTIQSRAYDAVGVTQLGRVELQNRLPDAMAAVQARLEADSPRLVNQALHSMVAALPELRARLVSGLNSRLDVMNNDLENNVLAVTREQVAHAKAQIDAAYPDHSDRQKLELLIGQVAVDFSRNFTSAIDALYPAYAAEMQRVRLELETLREKGPAELTREERLKKEIISTMVELARRSQADAAGLKS